MPHCRVVLSILLMSLLHFSYGQATETQEDVDAKSYRLYVNQQWSQLEKYGKEAISHHQDFILLRLRIAYACVMQQRYSEATKQYDAVLKKDRYNETARYFSWLCLQNLHQPELALIHASYLPKSTLKQEGINPSTLTGVDWEGSYKITDLTTRYDAMYHRIGLSGHVGWRWNMYNAVGFFQQRLDEPGLKTVTNNRSIQVKQIEFYHLSTINLNNRFQLKAGYHFINTPFSNYLYQNYIGIIGIKFHTPFVQVQASVYAGTLIDSALQQINIQATSFPFGNGNLYGISTLSIGKQGSKQQTNFKQVIGFKLTPRLWAEANATLGAFQNYLENDGLYVYNAIDPTNIKMGGSLYFSPSKKMILQGGYTFEQKNLFTYPNLLFNQHSINGGIKWTF